TNTEGTGAFETMSTNDLALYLNRMAKSRDAAAKMQSLGDEALGLWDRLDEQERTLAEEIVRYWDEWDFKKRWDDVLGPSLRTCTISSPMNK
ncbi:MAG: hypothetical protein KGL35_08320, partial [Bradyrhizobium sp.]|nr:hypothetical protein [Bradyrhizobium sp.]